MEYNLFKNIETMNLEVYKLKMQQESWIKAYLLILDGTLAALTFKHGNKNMYIDFCHPCIPTNAITNFFSFRLHDRQTTSNPIY